MSGRRTCSRGRTSTRRGSVSSRSRCTLDNVERYNATCRQAIPPALLAQIVPDNSAGAVRVDPDHRDQIALDLGTEPPMVTVPSQGPNQAARATCCHAGTRAGRPSCKAKTWGARTSKASRSMPSSSPSSSRGRPCTRSRSEPSATGGDPPAFNGSNVPVKVLADNANGVVIDWAAALAEYEKR